MNYTCDYSINHREMKHRLSPQVSGIFLMSSKIRNVS